MHGDTPNRFASLGARKGSSNGNAAPISRMHANHVCQPAVRTPATLCRSSVPCTLCASPSRRGVGTWRSTPFWLSDPNHLESVPAARRVRVRGRGAGDDAADLWVAGQKARPTGLPSHIPLGAARRVPLPPLIAPCWWRARDCCYRCCCCCCQARRLAAPHRCQSAASCCA